MNASPNDAGQSTRFLQPAFPGAPALAVTLVTVGAAYALPFLLFAENHPLNLDGVSAHR
jgi:hypothetical protein